MRRLASASVFAAIIGVALSGCGVGQDVRDAVSPPHAEEFIALSADMTGFVAKLVADPSDREALEHASDITPELVTEAVGYEFGEGVTLAEIDDRESMMALCFTGPENTYATVTLGDYYARRTFGTGGCDYEKGLLVTETDEPIVTGVDTSLKSDAKNVAVAVETWLTDHPREKVKIDDKFVADNGVILSEGNHIGGYESSAGDYSLCVLNADSGHYVTYSAAEMGLGGIGTDGSCKELPADPAGGTSDATEGIVTNLNGEVTTGQNYADVVPLDMFGDTLATLVAMQDLEE